MLPPETEAPSCEETSVAAIISADSHITEPPDTYLPRIDPKYRDEAPHLVTDDKLGDWAALLDMTTHSFKHTGTQSLVRQFIEHAVNEI